METRLKLNSSLARSEPPYYYMIHLVSDEPLSCRGTRCCSTERDMHFILEKYPYSRVEKYYLPETPQTVDVPSVRLDPDLGLPDQQSLPESCLEPFIPTFHD